MNNRQTIAHHLLMLTYEEMISMAETLSGAAQAWVDDSNQIDEKYMANLLIDWANDNHPEEQERVD